MLKTKLPIKSTVSKIKEKQIQKEGIDFEYIASKFGENVESKISSIIPTFMKENEEVSGSRKGTLMHLFLQKLNLKEDYNKEKLEDLKQKLISKKIISQEESKYINLQKVEQFLKSSLAERIKKSIKIEKEKAFCMKISAKEWIEEAKNEEILVQGIIDLYAIEEDGEIILIDYKTDFVNNEQDLINKYEKQLKLYKIALEEGIGRKVKEIYIYSLYLGKEICLPI